MSHEFRTPLNAILGYTHMLLQGVAGELPPNVQRQLTRIDSNGRHLLTIINEILDITRIEAGKMPMQISEFDLQRAGAGGDGRAGSGDLAVEADGDAAARRRIRRSCSSDRQKVKQIVVNLLSNALKFTHQGGIEIGVGVDTVRARRRPLP